MLQDDIRAALARNDRDHAPAVHGAAAFLSCHPEAVSCA
jgi:hypothetical protein